ncbi:hypothetical protein Skr01_75910 [Sphaerisporangium krabiense]|uniref:DUF397 domain-containing protein n=1 Tax=Sphaerisporangium krabiense TaxID=763782 RepID=A0A7W8ZA52_9ACTN|nr:DUF397 domain-containing protein [Sphaerisporangium krabiense]MBB5630212.1 hypothetical protein [Sphaerisporangium krabiense]GII67506.1 hypothetical protein Skr01_75910 [Sphaerisporangium krabiense]
MGAKDLIPAELAGVEWKKSSRSGNSGGNCVEVAGDLRGAVGVRDSKNLAGPVLVVRPAAWSAFLTGIKDGMLDG